MSEKFDVGVNLKEAYQPDAPDLTIEEMKFAKKEMIDQFPKVARHKFDPKLVGQEFTNLSFMLLKEPINGVYGFVKPRGSWPDADVATSEAERIIKKIDSVFKVHIAPTGHWSPITNNEQFTLDQLDVKTQEQDKALRDRAAKQAAEENESMRRELRENKERLEQDEDDDIDMNPDSLDYYTKKRVTARELNSYIIQGKEKLKDMKKKLRKVEKDYIDIHKKHPEFKEQWLDNYNRARKRAGLEPVTIADLETPNITGPIL